ncbi:MAG: hypothetical protein ABF274_00325 [Nonlabens sp.]|uniref:hypothetical protein n=1 Tax=Nonlabens sp. TaxID=1888209 RepID=UPI00321B351B
MKKIATILLLFLIHVSCNTTKTSLSTTTKNRSIDLLHIKNLSNDITETSGLEFYKNLMITHNDSGDLPTLYFLNERGEILKRKTYTNMSNVDWEDITKDEEFLYIADIGNNYGNRRDLVIYKIRLNDLDNENARVEKLMINYPNQKSFKNGNQNHPYDAESLVAIDNDLYVFSKDWKDQATIIYKIDKNKTQQSADEITSYNVKGLITGATYNGTDTVMLCGYNSNLEPFIVLIDYKNGKFHFHEKINIPIENGAQVEAITFLKNRKNQQIYYISCEAVNIKLGEDEAKTAAQLYQLRY